MVKAQIRAAKNEKAKILLNILIKTCTYTYKGWLVIAEQELN